MAGDFVEAFKDTFAAMEKHDIVLNLHGEVAGTPLSKDVTHEEAFLPTLKRLHEMFPKLRIVLEHCSTAAAIEAVKSCGPEVAGMYLVRKIYRLHDYFFFSVRFFFFLFALRPQDLFIVGLHTWRK